MWEHVGGSHLDGSEPEPGRGGDGGDREDGQFLEIPGSGSGDDGGCSGGSGIGWYVFCFICFFVAGVGFGLRFEVYGWLVPMIDSLQGVYLSDCQLAEASPHATDPETAERLWRLSEELVGQKFDIPWSLMGRSKGNGNGMVKDGRLDMGNCWGMVCMKIAESERLLPPVCGVEISIDIIRFFAYISAAPSLRCSYTVINIYCVLIQYSGFQSFNFNNYQYQGPKHLPVSSWTATLLFSKSFILSALS